MSLVEIDIRSNDMTGPGFASVLMKLAALKSAAGDIKIGVDFDPNTFDRLVSDIGRVSVYSQQSAHALEEVRIALLESGSAARTTATDTAKASDAMRMLGLFTGRSAGVFSILGEKVSLWGGVFKGVLPEMLAGASYLHIMTDAVIEFAAVWGPAIVAVTMFGVAAIPTVQDVVRQMQNLREVTTATNSSIYPLTGSFEKVANAVRPQVLQLFGDGLVIASQKSGLFQQVATSTGTVLDELGARLTVAMTNGKGFGGVMGVASTDVAKLGDSIGNIGGIFGSVFRALPGYAAILLNIGDAATHVAEVTTNAAEPIMHWGMIAHGAFLYAGLAATGFARLMPAVLGGVAGLATKGAAAAERMTFLGGASKAASSGMMSFAVGAEKAAAIPWGWVAIAAAGVGVLAYELITAKDATQQWLASLQHTIQSTNVMQGMTDIMNAQIQVASRLSSAQEQLANTQKFVTVSGGREVGTMREISLSWRQAQQQVADLSSGQRQLSDETNLFNFRVNALASSYGGWSGAMGMLVAAGVPMNLMLNKSSSALAQIKAMVLATSKAYQVMGQTGGRLGTDMAMLNRTTSEQYTSMAKLNQAWDNFQKAGIGVESNFTQMVKLMRQVDNEAQHARHGFTGVSNASLNMRNNMAQLLTTTQGMVDQLRAGNAPAHAMAQAVGSVLKNAVNAGALENKVFYQTAADMARQAGYTGDSIGALKAWVDRNATSTQKLSDITDKYGGNLNKLPTNKKTTVTNNVPSLIGDLHNYISMINSIPASKSTTVYLNRVGAPGHHAGGPVGAGGGGPSGSSLTTLNEQGPELVRLPTGSMTYSAADSARMMGERGGASGGGTLSLQIQTVGHDPFVMWIAELLRNHARLHYAGSAQRAFGYGNG